MEWHDPRLSRKAFPKLNRTRISLQDIWWPNIEFFNQHEPRNIANLQLGVRDDGTVVYEERFRVRLGSELNFRRFPFDRQDLLLQIESFRHDATQMFLVIRPGRQLKSLGAFLPDWSILGASEYLKMDDNNPDRKPYAMYVFVTQVQRKSASYIWNVLLPFALITVLSWVVFWIRNKDMSNIAITTLVAAVAFAFVVSGSRPRLSCMTFMDSVFLTSYFIIFLANVVSVAVHYMESPDRPSRSRVLVRTARWLLPVLYVASLCLSIGLFLLR